MLRYPDNEVIMSRSCRVRQRLRQLGFLLIALVMFLPRSQSWAQDVDTVANDAELSRYFAAETAKLASACLAELPTADEWPEAKAKYRQQLLEMLGLDPWPEKTDLQVQLGGIAEHDEFIVRNLHFQSRPGLYVTANLYVPREIPEPLPAILYVCGHGRVEVDGVSLGNKVHYQHHPAWFARNGYVCLAIDTLQLGEIEGIHHGTYREGMWWWLNRGYTPAGVEAWNCVRALDLLQSLPEVDGERLGVTGRSGGGAYSWWIAAIDDRIKCAVPVAGITDLQNHVVDGCVEGHCDCMFMVNTYRWDYPLLAAMVAPRPLLISNTDSDGIFPLDGVYRTHQKVKPLYERLGEKDNLALHITAGPHKDTQELRVHAFRWFNKHLKGDADSLVMPATKLFEPMELKVFRSSLPTDERNTTIHETFVAAAGHEVPASKDDWISQRDSWMEFLQSRVFRGWPAEPSPLNIETGKQKLNGREFTVLEFDSQQHVRLAVWILPDAKGPLELRILGESDWDEFAKGAIQESDRNVAWFVPRGVGPHAWNPDPRKQTQIRRRFYLLGQSLDGMQVYDVLRAVEALQGNESTQGPSVTLSAAGSMAGIAGYAALFSDEVSRLQLHDVPQSHRSGPTLLNVRRALDMPQLLAMLIADREVSITGSNDFPFVLQTARLLGREGSFHAD